MTLTINTNMASLTVQHNMDNATKSLNQSIERMTTGYKINAAKDDAAGYSVMTKMDTNLRSTSVCQSNVAMGSSLLSTLENISLLIYDAANVPSVFNLKSKLKISPVVSIPFIWLVVKYFFIVSKFPSTV